jgi:single-strand DNA-binding protein
MSSMNNVILMGGLTRDPDLRQTASGVAITKFSLAVTDSYKDKSGERKETTCYIDIDAWGRLGENCAQYLRKGSQAMVQGRLQLDQWEAKDGTKRSKLSVRATDVQFLSKATGGESAPNRSTESSATSTTGTSDDPWDEDGEEVPPF